MGQMVGAVAKFASAGVAMQGAVEAQNRAILAEKENQQQQLVKAADAEQRGAIVAGEARQRGSQLVAEQKVAYSAGGVDAGTGTAADVATQTSMLSEHDANTITANAAREAWGFKQAAVNSGRKQQEARANRDSAEAQGALSMIGGALSSMGSVGGGG